MEPEAPKEDAKVEEAPAKVEEAVPEPVKTEEPAKPEEAPAV